MRYPGSALTQMGKMVNRFVRLIRYLYLKLVRLKDKPHTVALGLAIGVFIGFTPTIPIQTYIALALAFLFKGSKLAAVMGVWISNPLNMAAFYFMDYKVGKWILGSQEAFRPLDYSIFTLLHEAQKAMKVMMVGGIILGIPAGIATYLITYQIVQKAKRRRELRTIRKNIEKSSHPRPS